MMNTATETQSHLKQLEADLVKALPAEAHG